MGMIGEYLKVDKKTFKILKRGKVDFYDFIEELDEEDRVDIDKAWHAIHFILSGKVWESNEDPISKMVLSGNELGENSDGGYGPAMYLMVDDVIKISEAAERISEEWFRQRFDVAKMKKSEIYLIESVNESEEELFEYVWSNFQDAKEFFKKAASEKKYIIFSVC